MTRGVSESSEYAVTVTRYQPSAHEAAEHETHSVFSAVSARDALWQTGAWPVRVTEEFGFVCSLFELQS